MDLRAKAAVVTGGASGIGEALARSFAANATRRTDAVADGTAPLGMSVPRPEGS